MSKYSIVIPFVVLATIFTVNCGKEGEEEGKKPVKLKGEAKIVEGAKAWKIGISPVGTKKTFRFTGIGEDGIVNVTYFEETKTDENTWEWSERGADNTVTRKYLGDGATEYITEMTFDQDGLMELPIELTRETEWQDKEYTVEGFECEVFGKVIGEKTCFYQGKQLPCFVIIRLRSFNKPSLGLETYNYDVLTVSQRYGSVEMSTITSVKLGESQANSDFTHQVLENVQYPD